MLGDGLVEVVELSACGAEQPWRSGVVGGGQQVAERVAHALQRRLQRGERVDVDVAAGNAQVVDIDRTESVGYRRGALGSDVAHRDDGVAVLGEHGHAGRQTGPRSVEVIVRHGEVVGRLTEPAGCLIEVVVFQRGDTELGRAQPGAELMADAEHLVPDRRTGDDGQECSRPDRCPCEPSCSRRQPPARR